MYACGVWRSLKTFVAKKRKRHGWFVGWQGTVRQRSPRQGRGFYIYIYISIYTEQYGKRDGKEKEKTRERGFPQLTGTKSLQCSLERGFNRFVQREATLTLSFFLSFSSSSSSFSLSLLIVMGVFYTSRIRHLSKANIMPSM